MDKNEKTPAQLNFQLTPEDEEMKKENDSFDALKQFEAEIGYVFDDISRLEGARIQASNKRTAFFGDAVLDFIVSEFLFKNYTELEQGQLTSLKSHLVCDEKLEKIVKKNGWDEYLIIEKGIVGRSKKMNSTFLEAVVGAIYLDSGLSETETFVYRFIVNKKEAEKSMKSLVSPKVKLYEFCQQHYSGFRPESFMISEDGPSHDRTFVMGYLLPKEITGLKNDIAGEGEGKTKSDAETKAAEKINRQLIRIGLMEK
ncbi:Ribonuclease 3 [Methanimicrococcus stummii]|uniref:Ribonuclease 3 n=1 Tax=Methanimicrococcus stummii TaxID=3028294 RepID=A0AA96V9R5_9EURY|nr:ribonuclease III domain-containing protein [Methanimicrococcus sp. Es2]WNY29367.1 Ribonuclease 3 [Methanimicrococcus sp. Es2]